MRRYDKMGNSWYQGDSEDENTYEILSTKVDSVFVENNVKHHDEKR